MAIAPPNSVEAEESVIGGILVHAARLLDVAPVLVPDDFYHPALRVLYEAMLALHDASRPVDALTVVDQLRAWDALDKLRAFNGADYLTDLMAKVVSVENIGYHALIVRSKAMRRRWTLKHQELAARGYGEGDDADFFADAQREMLALSSQRQSQSGGPKPMRDVMTRYHETLGTRVQQRQETGRAVTGVPMGFTELDNATAGLHPGNLVIVAARPAMGKTSFVMNLVTNGARVMENPGMHRRYPALVFSLEMTDQELAERSVSGEAHIDSQRLRHGDVKPDQWKGIMRALGNLADMPITIDDRGTLTLAELRSVATTWVMAQAPESKPKIVVDFLQLIKSSQRRNSTRNDDVSEISRELKQLAGDLKVPVIALSQLSRACESRPNKRPMLSDLRDSGAIEQDANVVMFIYRDEVYSKNECHPDDRGVAEIIIAKQRMGPCGTVRLRWRDAWTKFEDHEDGG
jgi:replicative DNA helicase